MYLGKEIGRSPTPKHCTTFSEVCFPVPVPNPILFRYEPINAKVKKMSILLPEEITDVNIA